MIDHNTYQNYALWGKEYILALGSRLITIGSKVYGSSSSLTDVKNTLSRELSDNPRVETNERFQATMNAQEKNGTTPDIQTSLYISFEGTKLPIWPILHRTHIITNQGLISAILRENRGGELLDIGDYDSLVPVMGSQNMLLCSYKDHTKLRKPLEKSFSHRNMSSDAMLSKIFSVANQLISPIYQKNLKDLKILEGLIFVQVDINHILTKDNENSQNIILGLYKKLPEDRVNIDLKETCLNDLTNNPEKFFNIKAFKNGMSEKSREMCKIIISRFVYNVIINLISDGKINGDSIYFDKLRDPQLIINKEFIDGIKAFAVGLQFGSYSENSLIDKMSALEDKEQLDTLLLLLQAATTTTRSSLFFLMQMITDHPKYKEIILEELRETMSLELGEKTPSTILDLINTDSEYLLHNYIKRDDTMLHYCYLETLRLFPAIPVIRRTAKKDFNFGETKVFNGDLIELNVMASQRDTKIWGEDANEFKPERFMQDPEKHKLLNNFSRGNTPCLGKHLAEKEIKVMGLLFCDQVALGSSEKPASTVNYFNDGLGLNLK
jgi:cytochrome P450